MVLLCRKKVCFVHKQSLGELYLGSYATIGRDLNPASPELGAAVIHTITLPPLRTDQAQLPEQMNSEARQALALREKTLGPDHPDTLSALFVLAENEMILRATTGRREALHRRAWGEPPARAGRRAPRHAHRAERARHVPVRPRPPGRGELLERRVVEISSRVAGSGPRGHAAGQHQPREHAGGAGRGGRAEALLRTRWSASGCTIGSDHPSTLDTMHTLGLLLQNAARHAESEPYTREVYATRLRVAGAGSSRHAGRQGQPGSAGAPAFKLEEAEALTARGGRLVHPAAGRPARDDPQQHEQPGHGAGAGEQVRGGGEVAAARVAHGAADAAARPLAYARVLSVTTAAR